MSQTALYSQVVGSVGGTGPATSLSCICNCVTWPGDVPSSQQQPKGSCKLQFENQPSVLSPHLDGVDLSWHWVVDAIDGEVNGGQGVDHRT